MFDWLALELSKIRTPRFHIVDGQADSKLREAIISSPLRLPTSYENFVLQFGNAKLYRKSRCGYVVGVFAGPQKFSMTDGTSAYEIGFHNSEKVLLKIKTDSNYYGVYERGLSSDHEVARDFDDWLKTTFEKARSSYPPEKWENIIRGPAPFSTKEKKIVETRRLIKWRVLGIDPSGDHIFEITNAGRLTLPVLTVGVRSKDGRFNGAVRLKIGHIVPGDKAVIHVACYKDLVQPDQIEILPLPDPQPEDREYYNEFSLK